MRSAVIVGAGAFGASLAWRLARAGTEVTLVDQFEPGDPRATSGGESRLIRCGHGADRDYTASARRARTLWRELEAETGEELLVESGLTWFAHTEDGFEARTIAVFDDLRIPYERLAPETGRNLFPSFDPDGLAFLLHEPEAGVLRAQQAVRALARQAVAHGAELVRGAAGPDGPAARLDDGRTLEGDAVVWACGGWLGRLFGDHVAIRTTCQELFFFDGGPAWAGPTVPAFVDFDRAIYGTRDLDGLGVKAAPDLDGPPLDPDAELPAAGAEGEAVARRVPRRALPGARGRAARRLEVLPLRAHARLALRRRPPPRARGRVAARRRLRPRLQARAGAGRAADRCAGRRGAAEQALRARRAQHAQPAAHRRRGHSGITPAGRPVLGAMRNPSSERIISMKSPSRRTRVALLATCAGAAMFGLAGPANAAVTSNFDVTTKQLAVTGDGIDDVTIECVGGNVEINGDDPVRSDGSGDPTRAPSRQGSTSPSPTRPRRHHDRPQRRHQDRLHRCSRRAASAPARARTRSSAAASATRSIPATTTTTSAVAAATTR